MESLDELRLKLNDQHNFRHLSEFCASLFDEPVSINQPCDARHPCSVDIRWQHQATFGHLPNIQKESF
ncbi:hypothetical protein HZB03_02570 [Candidatus Woesearchaeota archaeon]|nr:hypothetical protein [Candidatus Woesearchaeota archaeon]